MKKGTFNSKIPMKKAFKKKKEEEISRILFYVICIWFIADITSY